MTPSEVFRIAFLASAAGLMGGCGGGAPPVAVTPSPAPAPPPVAESVLPAGMAIEQTQAFVSPVSKKSYKIETVTDDRETELRTLPAGLRDVRQDTTATAGENYAGTARKAAKLSIAAAATQNFADVKDLIATLPAHNSMVNRTPKITTTAASNRVAEEKRNVSFKAFLYAASREDDNDFHLIVGRAPGAAPATYLTVELSGLPQGNSPAFGKLKAARDAFKTFFGNSIPGSGYDFYSPPIPVQIEGSLFFDISHATGSRPGPSALRPKMPVVWEVHPITKIVLEP